MTKQVAKKMLGKAQAICETSELLFKPEREQHWLPVAPEGYHWECTSYLPSSNMAYYDLVCTSCGRIIKETGVLVRHPGVEVEDLGEMPIPPGEECDCHPNRKVNNRRFWVERKRREIWDVLRKCEHKKHTADCCETFSNVRIEKSFGIRPRRYGCEVWWRCGNDRQYKEEEVQEWAKFGRDTQTILHIKIKCNPARKDICAGCCPPDPKKLRRKGWTRIK